MKRKVICQLLFALSIPLLVMGCGSTASPAQSTVAFDSATPTLPILSTSNSMSSQLTERVATVFAIQTASMTGLPTRPPTNTPSPEPTLTPKPTSKDDILVSYSVDAGDGVDEITSCLNGYDGYQFVLHRSGQLTVFDRTRYLATTTEQTEIERLLSEIYGTGISSVINDLGIATPPTPLFVGGWGSTLAIEGQGINTADIHSDEAAQIFNKVLDILQNYRPKSLQPYIPESITLWVYLEAGLILGPGDPAPEPPLLKWSTDEIDLENLTIDFFTDLPQVIGGNTLEFLLGQVKTVPAFRRVEQNGQSYYVLVCPNFH